jgi:hypothetical protein
MTSTDTVRTIDDLPCDNARIRAVLIFAMRSRSPAASSTRNNARRFRGCRSAAVGFDRRRS